MEKPGSSEALIAPEEGPVAMASTPADTLSRRASDTRKASASLPAVSRTFDTDEDE